MHHQRALLQLWKASQRRQINVWSLWWALQRAAPLNSPHDCPSSKERWAPGRRSQEGHYTYTNCNKSKLNVKSIIYRDRVQNTPTLNPRVHFRSLKLLIFFCPQQLEKLNSLVLKWIPSFCGQRENRKISKLMCNYPGNLALVIFLLFHPCSITNLPR